MYFSLGGSILAWSPSLGGIYQWRGPFLVCQNPPTPTCVTAPVPAEKLSFYFIRSRHNMGTGRIVWRHNCSRRLYWSHVVSSTSSIILEVVKWVSSTPRNTDHKNSHASRWQASSSQLSAGETFWRHMIRLVAVKEVSVPLSNTIYHRFVGIPASKPADGYRYGKRNALSASPTPSGSS